jgi:hypothetical protein
VTSLEDGGKGIAEKKGGWVKAKMLKTETLKERMDSNPRFFADLGKGQEPTQDYRATSRAAK